MKYNPTAADIIISARMFEINNYHLISYICGAGLINQYLCHKKFRMPEIIDFEVRLLPSDLLVIQSDKYRSGLNGEGKQVLIYPENVFSSSAIKQLGSLQKRRSYLPENCTEIQIKQIHFHLSRIKSEINRCTESKKFSWKENNPTNERLSQIFIESVDELTSGFGMKTIDVIQHLDTALTQRVVSLMTDDIISKNKVSATAV